MENVAPATGARFAALRYRNFTLLWSGMIVSNVGTWMQNVATGWLVLQLTDSPLWLGLLGLSFALPMMVFPLVGGAVADRVHRIRLLYITQTGSMLIAFALAALTWLQWINVWHILAATFLGAAFLAFDNPARHALLPSFVPPRDLLNAVSLNSATYNGAALVGPALAGALLGPIGAGALFFVNGVSYLAMIFALASMRDVPTHSDGIAHGKAGPVGNGGLAGTLPEGLGQAMLAGLSYSWHNRVILSLLSLSALAAVFGRSYQNLLPIFARDIWHAGPEGYGWLLSSAGGGAIVGAFGLASIRHVGRQGLALVVGGFVFTLCIILFAMSPSFIMGIVLLFISGIAATVFTALTMTFIQLATPDKLRGRVMSLYAITLIGLPSLGGLGTGASAEFLGGVQGAPRAVLGGAVILGIILVIVAPFFWSRSVDAPQQKSERLERMKDEG